ncbi:MAG: gamma-glutamyltransferase family protein [Phenylobacterium sp.]|uniref:gamma-glutamyltransferase family protein n=1 Tax=Phenylobacterium sp. TaxID=1871053 RepID=UPI0025FB8A0D|nr:gamma-glutamyltransferase [Phenylobacterium sp.]MBI1200637.1 gamma-glutamyltransferase family protein [Phenylobacterium sp.]
MSIDAISRQKRKATGAETGRPVIAGVNHMVSAGHYLAATAAFEILEAGGNAIDAGVAGGIALAVVQSELVNFAGVAPIIVRMGATGETKSIAGLGWWPRAMTPSYFMDNHGGEIPHGLARTVVPAAPDAWITALARFGTMSFGEVARAAIRLARDGFVMYPLMAELIATFEEEYSRWPSSSAVYLPNGRPPQVGEKFVQADLARTMQYMVDEEATRASEGREAGLMAARDAFYRGDIARTIDTFHRENGGFLTLDDMAGYSSEVEDTLSVDFGGVKVHGCGAWCQGPSMLQIFSMLEASGIADLPHNSPEYVHRFTEIIKLAFADRHAYVGDPRFVDVPVERLLSKAHAEARLRRIDPDRSILGLPVDGGYADPAVPVDPRIRTEATPPSLDTSYIAVVDRWGNSFSATPSDVTYDTPIIPGTGVAPSSRGSQSWADPRHPSSVAPGKRPRLTPSPALAVGADGRLVPFGTPGGDVQAQAMAQVLTNLLVFRMSPQRAVEAPRFASYSFPDSFEPHDFYPNRLHLETGVGEAVGEALTARGHDVNWWPDLTWRAGSVCLVDYAQGLYAGAADPRRPCYALGW